PARGEQFRQADVHRRPVGPLTLEDVVLGYLTAGWQIPPLRGHRFHLTAEVDLLGEQLVPRRPVLGALSWEGDVHVGLAYLDGRTRPNSSHQVDPPSYCWSRRLSSEMLLLTNTTVVAPSRSVKSISISCWFDGSSSNAQVKASRWGRRISLYPR